MTDIYIVRHGNTFDKGDVVTRVGARTDLPLSESGRAQAMALADHFLTIEPDGFAQAYSSPLLRTWRTAQTILNPSKRAPMLETLEFLREVDYGPDENQPENAVLSRIGEAAMTAWETQAVPPPGWRINPAEIRSNWSDLLSRLQRQNLDRAVLIVTSNGIARFVLDAVTDYDTEFGSIKLKTGAYGRIRLVDHQRRLVDWNVRP